jgi:Fe-S cluster assembly protein SufD
MTHSIATSAPSIGDAGLYPARRALSASFPDWLRAQQDTAWRSYLETPVPSRLNESWRFANLSHLRAIDAYQPTLPDDSAPAAIEQRSRHVLHVAGRIVLADDNVVSNPELDPALAAQGVVFTTLADAVANHPDLVQNWFMRHSPDLGSQKYEALHLALLRNGVFLYVPDGVHVELPFVAYHWAVRDNGALFPHTLFVTGREAHAELIEFQECANPASRHLVIANAHLFAGDNARFDHSIVQNWNRHTVSMQLNTSSADAETNAKSSVFNIGSAFARQEVHGRIFGSGSNVELYSLSVARGNQEIDQRTLQTHIAPNSRSDLLFKNAAGDQSRTIFSGLIIVEENAQQTDAYQTNNNLMLSNEAESNSLPGLEIKANDVKCSHGATSGRIDDTELFYFLARGIPRAKAQELLVFGYFEEIISKIRSAEVADFVRDRVQHTFIDPLPADA